MLVDSCLMGCYFVSFIGVGLVKLRSVGYLVLVVCCHTVVFICLVRFVCWLDFVVIV